MKRTLLALSAIAAVAAASGGVANAQGMGPSDEGYSDHAPAYRDQAPGYSDEGTPERCHLVITHRRGPNGSVTVRRRICE